MAPSSSRSFRSGLPLRKAARATRAVSPGTGSIGLGLRDMADLRGGSAADSRDIGCPAGPARFRQQYPEVLLHIVLHRLASVDPTVLSALIGGPRTGDLIKHIKIISEVTGADQSAIDENSRNFTQLSLISKVRDLLLHRKTEHYNGRFYVHNR